MRQRERAETRARPMSWRSFVKRRGALSPPTHRRLSRAHSPPSLLVARCCCIGARCRCCRADRDERRAGVHDDGAPDQGAHAVAADAGHQGDHPTRQEQVRSTRPTRAAAKPTIYVCDHPHPTCACTQRPDPTQTTPLVSPPIVAVLTSPRLCARRQQRRRELGRLRRELQVHIAAAVQPPGITTKIEGRWQVGECRCGAVRGGCGLACR